MCTLIHNVLTTDFLVMVNDDDAVKGLKIIHDAPEILSEYGVDLEQARSMTEIFGVSGVANIQGAIKIAKYLRLSEGDNIVTVATDGFDRYISVLENLDSRMLETEDFVLRRWFKDVFMKQDTENITDVRLKDAKERLFGQKEKDWIKFGYTKDYLDSMKDMAFWEAEYAKVFDYDKKIIRMRRKEQ
jgi:cysteine synthase